MDSLVSVLAVMGFLGMSSAAFFGLDAVMRRLRLGAGGQRILVVVALVVMVVVFGLIFGFHGYLVPSWEDRGRR